MTVTVPLVSGPSLPLTLSMRTAEARRPFLCSTLTNAMTCSFEVKATGSAHCIALIHLLLGPSRSRPRAGGGWARPLPSREGVGDGWSSSPKQPKQWRQSPGPPRLLIPPQVPLVPHGGAAGGSAVGDPGDEGCNALRGPSRERTSDSSPGA